jgi:hypothetical protein
MQNAIILALLGLGFFTMSLLLRNMAGQYSYSQLFFSSVWPITAFAFLLVAIFG